MSYFLGVNDILMTLNLSLVKNPLANEFSSVAIKNTELVNY